MSLHDDIDGVGVELGGRWPIKKLGLELEERGPQSCTCHLGRGGTLDDPDCPTAVRYRQWGMGLKALADRSRSPPRPPCHGNCTRPCASRAQRNDEARYRRQTRSTSRARYLRGWITNTAALAQRPREEACASSDHANTHNILSPTSTIREPEPPCRRASHAAGATRIGWVLSPHLDTGMSSAGARQGAKTHRHH